MKEYVKKLREKGWLAHEIAERWGVTPRRLSQISANPTIKDLDALAGLPVKEKTKKIQK